MREVTGFYYMTCWRYSDKTHIIKVIAPELRDAIVAVEKFLRQHGHNHDVVPHHFKRAHSISRGNTVIVADFYRESEDVYADGTPVPDEPPAM